MLNNCICQDTAKSAVFFCSETLRPTYKFCKTNIDNLLYIRKLYDILSYIY